MFGHLAAFSTGVPRGEGFWEHAVPRCPRGIRRGLAAPQEEDGGFPGQGTGTHILKGLGDLPGVGLRNGVERKPAMRAYRHTSYGSVPLWPHSRGGGWKHVGRCGEGECQ